MSIPAKELSLSTKDLLLIIMALFSSVSGIVIWQINTVTTNINDNSKRLYTQLESIADRQSSYEKIASERQAKLTEQQVKYEMSSSERQAKIEALLTINENRTNTILQAQHDLYKMLEGRVQSLEHPFSKQ